jgi:membrane-associated protease RseP (regulator of RpoE activity)
VPDEDEPRAYRQQPFHQRIIVASAGSVMHLLIALVLAVVLVLTFGQLTNNYTVGSLEHWHGQTTAAQLAGLRPGDTIVSVDGKAFTDSKSMTDAIARSTGKPLTLGVERDGRLIHLAATPKSGQGVTIDGTKLADHGYLGVSIDQATRSVAPLAVPGATVSTLWGITTAEVSGFGQIFSLSGLDSLFHQVTNAKAADRAAETGTDRPSSIIGIAHIGAQAEQQGLAVVLALLIAINIVFALLNMLPMIPLDGGHVAVAAYEWIRTKKGGPYYRADITKLFPVAALFIGFLALFALAAVFLDITHPLQLPH